CPTDGPRSRVIGHCRRSLNILSASPTMASRCSRSPRPGCTSRRTSADVPLPTARLDSQSRLYFLFTCIRAWIHVPDEKASQNRPKSWTFRGTTHYHGHRERLRDRFREASAESVNDYELLELVLFRAIPQRDGEQRHRRGRHHRAQGRAR